MLQKWGGEREDRVGREENVAMGDSVRSRGEMLFSRDFMIQYMKDVDSMLNKLPLYSKLNSLYAGGDHQSYSSPGIDYYRLQHTRRYRFKRLNSDKGCDCPSCQVGLDMATACVAVERPEEEKSEAIENCAFQKNRIFALYFLVFVLNQITRRGRKYAISTYNNDNILYNCHCKWF